MLLRGKGGGKVPLRMGTNGKRTDGRPCVGRRFLMNGFCRERSAVLRQKPFAACVHQRGFHTGHAQQQGAKRT